MIRQISRFFDTPFVNIKPNQVVTITCLRFANNTSTIDARKNKNACILGRRQLLTKFNNLYY